jgi:hypothetical protein
MSHPFLNQGREDAEVQAARAACPCPHTDADADGYCLTCDFPSAPAVLPKACNAMYDGFAAKLRGLDARARSEQA